MTCREFADFMAEYLNGDLASDRRSAFEHHLRLCVNCQKYLAGYQATVTLGRGAFADQDAPVPADVPEQLVRAILNARKPE